MIVTEAAPAWNRIHARFSEEPYDPFDKYRPIVPELQVNVQGDDAEHRGLLMAMQEAEVFANVARQPGNDIGDRPDVQTTFMIPVYEICEAGVELPVN